MNTKITPKDFFLHLGATIVLYASAIALINLAISIINYAVPDPLAGYFYSSSVAWPISMLVVLVPLLYVIEWLINRDVRITPEKRDIWIRRWRIYLTLFLSGALIVGDLIALLNTYLSGEITARFAYKVLAILIIAGVIFKYYALERWEGIRNRALWQKVMAWAGIVIVLTGIIGGFLVVGSPKTQRTLRFDQQRVNDLSNIQWQIINHWQRVGKLPVSLSELTDPISGNIIPNDPETDAPYEYRAKASTTFELCANFGLPTRDDKGRGEYGRGGISYPTIIYPGDRDSNWNHQAGRTCFERKIDPERYPPTPKQPVR